MALIVTAIIAALLGGAGIISLAFFQESVMILATIAFLGFVGLMLILRSIEAMSVGRNRSMSIILFILGISSLTYALFLLNPGMFEGSLSIGLSGSEFINYDSSYSLLSTMPISETPIGDMNPVYQDYYFVVLAGGFIYLLNEVTGKKRRK